MKALIYVVISFMVLAATPVAWAGKPQLPEFAAAGTIDRLDFRSGEIVIGDMFYRLGKNLIIHDEKGRLGGRKLLHEGVKAGVSPTSGGQSSGQQQSVYEIWVLPRNYDLGKTEDDE